MSRGVTRLIGCALKELPLRWVVVVAHAGSGGHWKVHHESWCHSLGRGTGRSSSRWGSLARSCGHWKEHHELLMVSLAGSGGHWKKFLEMGGRGGIRLVVLTLEGTP